MFLYICSFFTKFQPGCSSSTCSCMRVFTVPYYRKLTLHEIKVLEINANLMGNDFRMKKINAKEEVEFHNKGN